jgi:hypothetical protein
LIWHDGSMSLLSFLERFADDDACWAHLEALRWPSGPVSPKCGSIDNAHKVGRKDYR